MMNTITICGSAIESGNPSQVFVWVKPDDWALEPKERTGKRAATPWVSCLVKGAERRWRYND